MSKFGWDYPPGCDRTPWDGPDPPCGRCGGDPAACECQECPLCGAAGDPKCCTDHFDQVAKQYHELCGQINDAEDAAWNLFNNAHPTGINQVVVPADALHRLFEALDVREPAESEVSDAGA